jgi:hypothetical protein
MTTFFTPEPEGPAEEDAPKIRLAYPVRLIYRRLWLNFLFVFLLASNLCFPRASDDLDME